jgi:hypothetical protein
LFPHKMSLIVDFFDSPRALDHRVGLEMEVIVTVYCYFTKDNFCLLVVFVGWLGNIVICAGSNDEHMMIPIAQLDTREGL